MQGTILILDGVTTNRIMLKVQLSAAYFHVVQSESLDGLADLLRRTQPDLIVTAMSLPDGTAFDVLKTVRGLEQLMNTPIIAIAAENDRKSRLAALSAGLNEVLTQPIDDLILQARIRSLLRNRDFAQGLGDSVTNPLPGLSEATAIFEPAATVALVTQTPERATKWRAKLAQHTKHRITTCQFRNISCLMKDPVPDAIVIEIAGAEGLRLTADLRARKALSHCPVIGVTHHADPVLTADALDRGAYDVMQKGFVADELALRLKSQLLQKASADQLRASVKNDLRAALRDPMTGLFNRRHAFPRLSRIARDAEKTRNSFAVMVADLDHFKRINDQHGHVVGDAVLIEAARRLSAAMGPNDLLARIGGEEFLIAMPDTPKPLALAMADHLRNQIQGQAITVPGVKTQLNLTISIGLLCGPVHDQTLLSDTDLTLDLIERADNALYAAKNSGRNQVSIVRNAA